MKLICISNIRLPMPGIQIFPTIVDALVVGKIYDGEIYRMATGIVDKVQTYSYYYKLPLSQVLNPTGAMIPATAFPMYLFAVLAEFREDRINSILE